MRKKLGAGIVTYNKKELFQECLNSLLNQTFKPDSIYIFDNASTDGTTEFILRLFFNDLIYNQDWINSIFNNVRIFYKRNNENMGSSMGFFELSKKMFDDGYEYILITDDDVLFKEDYIEKLLDFTEKNNYKMVTSLMVENFKDFKVKSESPIFAGGLVSRDVFEKIGFPVNDYFIYWDDVEFILRAEKAGFKIQVCKEAFCIHDQFRFNKSVIRKQINFLGFKKEFANINEWKIYYSYRNMVITLINHKRFFDLSIKIIRAIILAFIFLIYKEINKFRLILWGLKDGLLMRKGKNEKVFKFK